MDYRELTLRDVEEEKRLVKLYENQIKRLPAGCLSCRKNGKYREYYHVKHGSRKRTFRPRKKCCKSILRIVTVKFKVACQNHIGQRLG